MQRVFTEVTFTNIICIQSSRNARWEITWMRVLEAITESSQISLEDHYEEVQFRATDFTSDPLVNCALAKIARYISQKLPPLDIKQFIFTKPIQIEYRPKNWQTASFEALASKLPIFPTNITNRLQTSPYDFLNLTEEEFQSSPELIESLAQVTNFIVNRILPVVEQKLKEEVSPIIYAEDELAELYDD